MSRPVFAGRCRTCCAPAALAIGAALLLPASVPFSSTAQAQQQSPALPPVVVEQNRPKPAKKPAQNRAPAAVPAPAEAAHQEADQSIAAAPANSTTIAGGAIDDKKPATNNTAQLLAGTPGVSFWPNGGVSSLPAIHGLADDRVKIELDGMQLTSGCPNHMNPVLSYADPASVSKVQVIAGITPVSAGGDSLGGTIRVDGAAPRFAALPGEVITYGSVSVFGRSNGDGFSIGGTASAATQNINVTYTGSWARSNDYKDGAGATVGSTLYETENHKLSVAVRDNTSLFILNGGVQHIPYEGFPNQPMDMTYNVAWFLNASYTRQFDWGKIDLRAYYQDTHHEMNFLADKGGDLSPPKNMPMDTHGQNFGYSAKAEIKESPRDMLRVGNELRGFLLDDWWPSTGGMPGMMCCNTFWNIHNGERYDVGTYLEWERKWNPQWGTLLGVRNDTVWMNTGNVQGYSTADYGADAAVFNAENHARTDVNFDATALVKYEPDLWSTFEGGYAMKSRSPTLYERYAWSTNSMAMSMNGWFGDGNYYTGNINLKPETAHTFSYTAGWHDAGSYKDGGSRDWEVKVTPYYSYIEDYIDADRCGPSNTNLMMMTPCTKANLTKTSGQVALIFQNHDAEMFGVDISARKLLVNSDVYGRFTLLGVFGYVHSRNLDTGDNLYGVMPLNAKFTLQHSLENWSNSVELQLTSPHGDVSQTRDELQTPGYALVNLRSSYQLGAIRFDVGVENLFNQQYYIPLGGRYLDFDNATRTWNDNGPLPGMGRTVYAGVTVKF